MAPFLVLTLLDVTSYIIARTLGVIDDTKASTTYSDPNVPPTPPNPNIKPTAPSAGKASGGRDKRRSNPSILVQSESETTSVDEGSLSGGLSTPSSSIHQLHGGRDRNQHNFFPNGPMDEGNLKLSGVDMFSPAPSQPPSPTLSRRDLNLHMTHQVSPTKGGSVKDKGKGPRKEKGGAGRGEEETKEEKKGHSHKPSESSHSSSGESSFAMLERESGEEDVDVLGQHEGMHIRKRRAVGEGGR